jgi:hypothetical protein
LRVGKEKYPLGILTIQAQVKYLTIVWGHSNVIPTLISTSHLTYVNDVEANARIGATQGARAVVHAEAREIQPEEGRAIVFVDQAVVKLGRYRRRGKYEVFASIDVGV